MVSFFLHAAACHSRPAAQHRLHTLSVPVTLLCLGMLHLVKYTCHAAACHGRSAANRRQLEAPVNAVCACLRACTSPALDCLACSSRTCQYDMQTSRHLTVHNSMHAWPRSSCSCLWGGTKHNRPCQEFITVDYSICRQPCDADRRHCAMQRSMRRIEGTCARCGIRLLSFCKGLRKGAAGKLAAHMHPSTPISKLLCSYSTRARDMPRPKRLRAAHAGLACTPCSAGSSHCKHSLSASGEQTLSCKHTPSTQAQAPF